MDILCYSMHKLDKLVCLLDAQEETLMRTDYKKLWKLLIDREMSKSDLRRMTGMSTTSGEARKRRKRLS